MGRDCRASGAGQPRHHRAGAISCSALAARSIANAVAATPAYASNVKVNGAGIDMTVDTLVPLEGSNVKIEDQQVTGKSTAVTVPGNSEIVVQPASISLTSGVAAPLQSALNLTPNSAQLSTLALAGSVSLTQPAGGSATSDAGGLTVNSPQAVSLQGATGVSIQSAANVTLNGATGATLQSAGSVSVKGSGISIDSTGSTSLFGSTVSVNGQIILIG